MPITKHKTFQPQPGDPVSPMGPDKLSLGQLPNGRVLALPSWVRPGSLAENCAWLAGQVAEVGLLFMESRACLAYGPADLPPWLADLPLRWHVHLPVDLPWNSRTELPGRAAGLSGGRAAERGIGREMGRAAERAAERAAVESADICLALMEKLDFLQVRRAVLHPPPVPYSLLPDPYSATSGSHLATTGPHLATADPHLPLDPHSAAEDLFLGQLEIFTTRWRQAGRDPADLLLENLPPAAAHIAAKAAFAWLFKAVERFSCAICFDFGHFLLHSDRAAFIAEATGRKQGRPEGMDLPSSVLPSMLLNILKHTKLLHCCTAAHRPLIELSGPDRDLCGEICRLALAVSPAEAVFMLELFNWEDIRRSLPLLRAWLEQ